LSPYRIKIETKFIDVWSHWNYNKIVFEAPN
jgi:hypothetical protein